MTKLNTSDDKNKLLALQGQLSVLNNQRAALEAQLVLYADIIQYAKQATALEQSRLLNGTQLVYTQMELADKARDYDVAMQSIPSTIADLQTKFSQVVAPTENLVQNMRLLRETAAQYGADMGDREKVATYERLQSLIGACSKEMSELLRVQRGDINDFKFTQNLEKAKADLETVGRTWSALKQDPGLNAQFQQLSENLKRVDNQMDLRKWTAQFSTFKSEVKAAGKNMQSLSDILKNNVGKVLQWVSATTLLFRAFRLLRSALTTIVDLDTAMIDLQKVTTATREEYDRFYHIQAMALESTAAGKTSQQQQLTEINEKISAKNSEIEAQETVIANLQAEIDRYTTDIQGVVEQLSISKYFTKAEQKILNHYLIEGEAAEETFVATDVDTSASGAISTLQGEVTLTGADIAQASLNGKSMYAIAGGVLKIASAKLTADIVRGTLEVNPSTNEYVLTVYMGSTTFDEHSFPSGLVTASGILSQFSSDISPVSQDGVTENKGTQISFEAGTSKLFFTVNVNEYQKYSVAQELYAFGEELLDEWAWPVYEFSIDTANFLFQKEFEPFKNKLEFGKSIYLNVGDGGVIEPKLIGVALDFENPEKLTLTFSNRFQKRDVVANWLSEVNKVSASSRSFDTSKYLYNRTANKTTQVSQFMENALNAAVNTIIGASNQSVVINGAGIQVGGDSKYQLRIVDNMIAMTDDGWKTAKLGIGRFYSDAKTGLKDDKGNDILIGETWGINTELLAGSLIIGNNLVLENANDNGVMQFKVDATGAWLYNASYIMQHDDGGLMIFDPKYGIVAGNKLLFNTNGTTVTPEFIDDWGDIKFDADGMPENANFYLDLRDGSAYFRGRIKADSGSIGGWELAENELHCGSNSTFVALNSSKDTNSLYAIWAGATKPENAKFWVKRDGTLHARDGEFSGTLSASRLSGNLTADPQSGGWLKGCGIDVNNGAFYVDPSGNVTMKGSINMADGSITWGSGNSPCLVLYCSVAASPPTGSYNSYPSRGSTSWHKSINDGDLYASYTYDGGVTWTSAIKIRGEDGQNGKDGQDGMDGSDATVNERNVFNVLTNGGTKFGVFSDSSTRKLYINASYIRAGQIDADLITLGSEYGGFCCARGSDGVSFTYGAKMYGSDDEYYFIATNKGVRMQAPDHGFTITNNGLFADEEISVGSDRRLKQAIEYRMDKYENFFMKLKPTQYQLKAGKSKRLHTGFIAQDVERALLESGLTTNDFAGLTITPVQEVNPKDGIDDVFYRLRYGEFISLNTYMIQTLYRRISELEEKIKSL